MIIRRITQLFLLACLIVSAVLFYYLQSKCSIAVAAAHGTTQPVGVAVVELFTSQGCSSCPSAEKVLGSLTHSEDPKQSRIFTLAFHVDYWNNAGWADPFSDAAYSARQVDYESSLHLDQIYTPQMIVNGKTEFVGSDREKAECTIAAALATQPAVPVTIPEIKYDASAGVYRLKYAAPAAGAGEVVNIALVEQGLSTEVKRGENAGHTLEQPSVVRWFKSEQANTSGEIGIKLPPGAKAERSSVVVYVQRSNDRAVLGAAAEPLPK